MPAAPPLALEVVAGGDQGARLEVDGRVRTIGRAPDADLILSDPGVSRRHVQVVASAGGVQLQACGGAAAFLVGGRPHLSFEAQVGEHVVVGNTILAVVSAQAAARAPQATDVEIGTLLTGVGADALAMGAIYELIEELDKATTRETLDAALVAWTSRQRPQTTVTIEPASPREDRVVSERVIDGSLSVRVPAPAEEPVSLEFRSVLGDRTAPQSLRRMLVVAGRLFGSSVSRVRRAEIDAGEVASLRALSFGKAHDFLGSSEPARQLAAKLPKLAASDVTVLLQGETGVGKSFFARLIHEASPRAAEPLRVINCASIPESLLESELFGHERGAFTGAASARAGALESAGRGTLFLDELGELSMASQAKLLRALEEKRFERLGSSRPIELKARVICATNRDLEEMVRSGRFRSDLLFRVSVVRLTIPSLHERGDDIVLLAKQLLADAVASAPRRIDGFAPDAMAVIRGYSWPGNVRELRNAIEHAIVLGDGNLIGATDLPAGILGAPGDPPDRGSASLLTDAVESAERNAIAEALRATGGNRTRAAALLGISRVTLYAKLRKL